MASTSSGSAFPRSMGSAHRAFRGLSNGHCDHLVSAPILGAGGNSFAAQTLYGESLIEDTIEEGYSWRSASRDNMPQHQKKSYSIHLSEGIDYRIVFLAQYTLSDINVLQ